MSKQIYTGHFVRNGNNEYKVINTNDEQVYFHNGKHQVGIFKEEAILATDPAYRVMVQAGSQAWWEELILWIAANMPTIINMIKSLLLIFANKQKSNLASWILLKVVGKKNIEKFEETVCVVV